MFPLGDGESVADTFDGSIVSLKFISVVGKEEGRNEGLIEGDTVTSSSFASGVRNDSSSFVDARDDDDSDSSFDFPKTTLNVMVATTSDKAAMVKRKSCRRCILLYFVLLFTASCPKILITPLLLLDAKHSEPFRDLFRSHVC